MSDQCSVCRHPEREDVDMALLAGQMPLRQLAARWGLSKSALWRHKRDHLPLHLAKAAEGDEVASAERLLSHLEELRTKALAITARAEKAGELNTALAGIREARQVIQALSQIVTVRDLEEQLADIEETLARRDGGA